MTCLIRLGLWQQPEPKQRGSKSLIKATTACVRNCPVPSRICNFLITVQIDKSPTTHWCSDCLKREIFETRKIKTNTHNFSLKNNAQIKQILKACTRSLHLSTLANVRLKKKRTKNPPINLQIIFLFTKTRLHFHSLRTDSFYEIVIRRILWHARK